MLMTLFWGPPTIKNPVKDRTNSRILEDGKTTKNTPHRRENIWRNDPRSPVFEKIRHKKSIIAEK